MLNQQELIRYNRHLILPGFGKEGQEKLKQAKVLVIGAGGLGCPVLQYLTGAGVGTIGVIDFDKVEESNLQRQVLFSVQDIGRPKAEAAAIKLKAQNPYIDFKIFPERLTKDNALDIFKDFDLVIDGSDNFPTRYLVNDTCVILNKPLVFGSIFKFEGQVSVFNYKDKAGNQGPTYRCLFPAPPAAGDVPNCSEIGVLGVLPGLVGCIQANEAIKVITGIGEPLVGKLLMLDALTMSTQIVQFKANPENFCLASLGDYEEVCETPASFTPGFKEITVQELKKKIDNKEKIFLLDVREPHEFEICHLDAKLIPMNTIPQRVDEIPTDIPVIVYCHLGMRSAMVAKFLDEEFQFHNLYNLQGGIHAWASEIDKEMPKY